MIITNETKGVKVLKAVGMPNIRLFPGPNKVEGDVAPYFKDNKAAQGWKQEFLKIVKPETLNSDEIMIAERSKERNDDLNSAKKAITANLKKIESDKAVMSDQSEQLAAQASEIKELKKQMKEMMKAIKGS